MARRAALLAWVALALVPAAHAAGFSALQGPPGFLSRFAASGDAWVAVTEGAPPQAFVSRDGAASWQAVPINGVGRIDSLAGPSVGPDGAFYISVSDGNGGLAILRLDARFTADRLAGRLCPGWTRNLGAGG